MVFYAVYMMNDVEAWDDGNDTVTLKAPLNDPEIVVKCDYGPRLCRLTLGAMTPEAHASLAVAASERPSEEALVDAK